MSTVQLSSPDRAYIESHFKLVQTNTGASTIGDAIERAHVVLLCERHNSSKYASYNSELVKRIWIPGTSRLFLENSAETEVPLVGSEIARAAERWDSQLLSEEDSELLDTYEDNLLSSALMIANFGLKANIIATLLDLSHLKDVSRQMLETKTSLKQTIEELKKFDFFPKEIFQDLDDAFERDTLHDFLQAVSRHWVGSLREFFDATSGVIERSAQPRNEELKATLIKAHSEGCRQITLAAGTDHLNPRSREALEISKRAATKLYEDLDHEGIFYVTLKATKKNQPVLEEPFKGRFLQEDPDFMTMISRMGDKINEYFSSRDTFLNSSSLLRELTTIRTMVMERFISEGLDPFDELTEGSDIESEGEDGRSSKRSREESDVDNDSSSEGSKHRREGSVHNDDYYADDEGSE